MKNEARSAFKDTRTFYREYISGMNRETLGKEFQADSARLRELYREAVGEETDAESARRTGLQKFYRFFLTMTRRLNPTRRLVFGISCISFILHYLFSLLGLSGYLFYPLFLPIAFGGATVLLLVELLEKTDAIRELDLARDIQLSLLPNMEVRTRELDIYAFANTAKEVGGDYVDIMKTENGTYVIIADVSGKGLSAALYMVRIQALVHLLVEKNEPTPKELFLELNDYVKSNKQDKTFVTACAAFFPEGENTFMFARAGHNTPVLYSSGKDATYPLKPEGFALGMTSTKSLKHQLEEVSYAFNPGDSVLFYTDGLPEARNAFGEEYGTGRIESLMSIYGSLNAKTISTKLHSSLEKFISGEKTTDDITFAAVHKLKESGISTDKALMHHPDRRENSGV
ncbi:MAG: PP2C family protein-serine/threonine phosphatase [Balneolaceae bacterium]